MTASTSSLTGEQLEQFQRDGYIVLPGVFTADELDALRAEADRILEFVINAAIAAGRRSPRVDLRPHVDGWIMRKIQPINDLSDVIASVSSDERLLAPMRELMGDEPVIMEEKLNYKQVIPYGGPDLSFFDAWGEDDSFELHHDWGYYRQQGYPENTISSAVAIDDCAGRGPLRVIPGSHLLDPILRNPDPKGGDGRVAPGQFGDERTILDVPAGTVLLFHAKLLHDSEPNRSGLPRRVMIYSHYPKSHDGGHDNDRRNGWLRNKAQPMEADYRAKLESGEYVDTFHLA